MQSISSAMLILLRYIGAWPHMYRVSIIHI